MKGVTKGAPDDGWAINDRVIRLRGWGDGPVYPLPADGSKELIVGSDDACDLRLDDPSGCVSRRHASLVREGSAWMLRDVGSTNGIRLEGELRQVLQLAPGVEIKIGGVVLIAESKRLIELHELLARVLGWDRARATDVDHALRVVREVAAARSALILCGDGDLGHLVRRIQALAVGEQRPFVLCTGSIALAVEEAGTGTVCVVGRRQAGELAWLREAMRTRSSKVRVVICCPSRDDATLAGGLLERTAVLEVPAVSSRLHEIDRLITEFAGDAARTLGVPGIGFREHEMTWLRPIGYRNLDHVAEITLRVVALRHWGVKGAARRLGISHPALSQWAQRYRIPTT